ncbi:MAG: DUF362 domain-containing protein [Chitinivibrionales bacterium]|nr:DUF362 domain-containing protein [Chitinivibrionales bacterium]MBD3394476.1 DUF362 domain-containing protein [Chitinivibrionales bacterium]
MHTTRRDFLKTSAGATAALAAGATSAHAAQKSTVYVGKGGAEKIIPKIFEKMGGIGSFVKKGSRVLIKPNMSFANPPEWGSTTSPEAVHAVTKLCLDAGAKRVIICDNTLRDVEMCKQKTGIADAVKGLKGAVIFTPKNPSLFVEKTEPKATDLKRVSIVKELKRTDLHISLPIAKSHGAGGVSMNLKGQMGLIMERGRMHSEMDLHKAIAELLYYMKPHVSIVDATRAMLDNGPAGPGTVVDLNTFVGGTDPVAVDSYSVSLASWYGTSVEGKNVAHIKYAAELGFGNVESSMISQVGV